jgi:hypothetical protein
MSNHTHHTAPTQSVEANGIRFAYRRFGKKEGIPLVFIPHILGNMDSLDPSVTDGFAQAREVIHFKQCGYRKFERRGSDDLCRDGEECRRLYRCARPHQSGCSGLLHRLHDRAEPCGAAAGFAPQARDRRQRPTYMETAFR